MSKINFHKLGPAVLAALLVTPFAANAESDYESTAGAGNLTATAHVDFRVTIEKFLYLQVGTVGGTIDLVQFNVPAANVGNGNAVAGTGGDLLNGAVTTVVRGNNGTNISLTATAGGTLSNGAGGVIDFTDIGTATSNGALPAPALTNASASSQVNAVNGIVDQTATWTYTYANTAVKPAGTYGGVNVNNGRVIYTATFL